MKKSLLTLVAVSVAALGLWYFLNKQTDDAEQQAFSANTGHASVIDVSVATVARQQLQLTEDLPGRTAAYRIAEVRPQVGGIVLERFFREGAFVEKGERLYQLESSLYQAALNSAQANLRNSQVNLDAAKQRLERYKTLLNTEAISQQIYDDAVTELGQAQAAQAVTEAGIKTAELNLDYSEVYAPISGRIGRSFVTEGALVTANQVQAMAVITQLDPIFVDLNQSSSENLRLRNRAGASDLIPVSMVIDGLAGSDRFEGELQFSEVIVNESTGSVQLRALFPNPDYELLPGLFVTASLHIGSQEAILTPQQSVIRDANGDAQVWVIDENNTANLVSVKAGKAIANQWLITDGLEDGDTVVVEGFQRLRAGLTVRPLPPFERHAGK